VLREYEFTLISNPQLVEQDMEKHLAKYEAILLADGGQMVRKDVWGTKKLSYAIKRNYRGHFVCYDFVGEPKNLAEAERLMRIDDNVLRYLSVRLGENVDVDVRKAEIAKAEALQAAARRESQSNM
jgi:small subunit ribosomal protein S6